MVRGGLARQVFGLLSSASTRNKAARLLYILSFGCEDRESLVADEDAAQLVVKLLGGTKCVSVELGALVANISLNDQFALYVAKPKLVGRLVDKLAAAADLADLVAAETDSVFVLKALRHVASSTFSLAMVRA